MADISKNAVHCFPRYTEELSLSGGSWHATYGLANLTDLPLSFVARSASLSTAHTQMLGVMAKPRLVSVVTLVGHNGSLNGSARVRYYEDAAATSLVHDMGEQPIWPIVYPLETCIWGCEQWWTGKYTADEIAGYRWTRAFRLDSPVMARAIKVDIDDTSNPAGFFQLGMLDVALGSQWGVNFGYDKQFGFDDLTELQRASGGEEYATDAAIKRIVTGQYNGLNHDEAMTGPFEMQRQLRKKKPFVFMPFPASPLHHLRDTILCRQVELPMLSHIRHRRDRYRFTYREV